MSNAQKLAALQEIIGTAEANLRSAKKIIAEITGVKSSSKNPNYTQVAQNLETSSNKDNIVEGIFDGQTMTDKNGKNYPVPANYASKSKLIPGDTLKLTINNDGKFLYKQIGPTERKHVIGTLTHEDGQYKVIADSKAYNVLLASVTYFKAEIGDKITLVVPSNEDSKWGAIENVLPKEPAIVDIDANLNL